MRLVWFVLLGVLSNASLYAATVTGNHAYPEPELLEYLSTHDVHFAALSRGEPEQLERSRELLELFYQDRGYLLARVQAGIPPSVFRVVEGPKVSSIRLFPEGNHEIADKTLRRLVGDSAGISRIRQGILEIKKTYRDRGFLQARLGQPVIEVVERAGAGWPVPVTPKPSNYGARVKLSIFEGPRFRYRKVQLPSLYSDLSLQLPAAGDYYSETELADFRETLLKHFRTNGRFLADFRVREQLDPTTRSVDLTVAFRVLPALSVGTIEFTGYSVFPDSFYRRELHLGEAEPLDPQKLEQSLEALRRTGALSSIRRDDVQITVHVHEGEADLLIHLNEKDRQRVQFSAGPNSLRNLELSLLYAICNLFGLEEQVGLQLQAGSNMSEVAVGAAFRHLVGSRLPFDLAAGFFRRSMGLRLPGVDEHVRRLLLHKSHGLRGSARFRFSRRQSISLASSVARTLDTNPGLHWMLRPSWQLDESTSRVARRLQAGQRFSVFEGTPQSWNWGWDASWNARVPVAGQPRVSPVDLRFRAAWVRFFGEAGPLSQRLLLNHDELRGFSSSSGPWGEVDGELIPVGGDTAFSLSSEYDHRLHSMISLVPFADAGILFSRLDSAPARQAAPTNRIWRSSLGSELRLRLTDRLPTPRLILAWNPLRLDRRVLTPKGLARLRDPAFTFRVRF